MIPQTAPLSRRRVLTAAAASAMAAGGVTGCSPGGGRGGRAEPGTLPEPGAAERARALRDSTALLAAYDAAVAARPSLAARLGPLRAEVARHVSAFGGTPAAPPKAAPGPTATAKPSPTGTATAGVRSAPTPSRLAAMERALADRRAAALLDVPGDLARLLASVAAAGASHAVLLTAGNK